MIAAALVALPTFLLMQERETVSAEPASLVPASGRVEQAVELGQVRWRRDFDAALTEAKAAEKPVLILFQEVPG